MNDYRCPGAVDKYLGTLPTMVSYELELDSQLCRSLNNATRKPRLGSYVPSHVNPGKMAESQLFV